jgi:hypothetical protein
MPQKSPSAAHALSTVVLIWTALLTSVADAAPVTVRANSAAPPTS